MKELFDFLNAQSGDRLLGYGLILIIALFIIVNGLMSIVSSITSIFKNKQKKVLEKDKNNLVE